MYRYIEIMLSKKQMKAFGFLGRSPTLAMMNGGYYLLIYYEPPTVALYPILRTGFSYSVHDTNRKEQLIINGWEVVRDLKIAICPDELLEILKDLDFEEATKYRSGSPIVLQGWMDEVFQQGLYTKRETYIFVRRLFEQGYDIEAITSYFALLARREELTGYFCELVRFLIRKGEAWTKRNINEY